MHAFKHWTPRYISDRLRVIVYERSHPDEPWLTSEMVRILSSWLKPHDVGLEWGSGRSTVWLAKRLGRLTSVEHDQVWYRKVNAQLQQLSAGNVEYKLRTDEADYVAVVDEFAPDSLDFCLVDGVARDRCAIAVVPKIKPGGILVIDNCNWFLPSDSKSPNSQRQNGAGLKDDWQRFLDLTKEWRYIWTSSGVTDSAFWVKPQSTQI